jgi:hypothetical protein
VLVEEFARLNSYAQFMPADRVVGQHPGIHLLPLESAPGDFAHGFGPVSQPPQVLDLLVSRPREQLELGVLVGLAQQIPQLRDRAHVDLAGMATEDQRGAFTDERPGRPDAEYSRRAGPERRSAEAHVHGVQHLMPEQDTA